MIPYPICLIGDKLDLTSEREVQTSEGAELAAALDLRGGLFKTLARIGENVEEAFTNLVKEISQPTKIKPTADEILMKERERENGQHSPG